VSTDRIESHWQRCWKPNEVRLFWYVIPPETVYASVLKIQAAVDDASVFAPMPLEWLHLTLVLTTAHLSEAPELLSTAQAATTSIRPFTVQPHIEVWSESIVCVSSSDGSDGSDSNDGWLALRAAIANASAPYTRHRDFFVPHMSVAYAHGDADAGPVTERLAAVEPPPPWTVSEVHLLAVEQKPGPEHGWYDWVTLGTVTLGP
jgi:2'-5' RNA ligase